jgi:DNA-nicking Smr family endonuclease
MADESGRGEATVAKVSLLDDDFAVAPPDSNTGIRVPDETDDAVESEEAEVTPPVNRPAVVSRTIDLGDGSGKQVFTAPTAEELLDKLTTAQENATRKIRQQEYELKRQQRHRPETEAPITSKKRDLSADELFALANELQKNPAAAINKLVEASTGSTLDDLGKVVAEYKTQSAINAADTQFLLNHQDDFLPSGNNARLMNQFLIDEKLPHTAKNLEYAFQELTESGLLDVAVPEEAATKDGQRIAVQTHTRKKPMSTGLRAKDGAVNKTTETVPEQKGLLSESEVEQLYKLPQEEARVLMNKFIQRARSRQQ